MTRITNVAAKPMPIETRPPSAARVIRSRPKLSVPNGCSRLGVAFLLAKSISLGSYGETIGQKMQKRTRATKTIPATSAPLLRM